jgi:hypothetical protein
MKCLAVDATETTVIKMMLMFDYPPHDVMKHLETCDTAGEVTPGGVIRKLSVNHVSRLYRMLINDHGM